MSDCNIFVLAETLTQRKFMKNIFNVKTTKDYGKLEQNMVK